MHIGSADSTQINILETWLRDSRNPTQSRDELITDKNYREKSQTRQVSLWCLWLLFTRSEGSVNPWIGHFQSSWLGAFSIFKCDKFLKSLQFIFIWSATWIKVIWVRESLLMAFKECLKTHYSWNFIRSWKPSLVEYVAYSLAYHQRIRSLLVLEDSNSVSNRKKSVSHYQNKGSSAKGRNFKIHPSDILKYNRNGLFIAVFILRI